MRINRGDTMHPGHIDGLPCHKDVLVKATQPSAQGAGVTRKHVSLARPRGSAAARQRIDYAA
jgi:hypothetical protein